MLDLGEAAVDLEFGARDVGGVVGEEEEGDGGGLLGGAEAGEGDHGDEGVLHALGLVGLDARGVEEVRRGEARGDGVDADLPGSELLAHDADHGAEGALGRRVDRRPGSPHGVDRARVDADRPAVGDEGREAPRLQQGPLDVRVEHGVELRGRRRLDGLEVREAGVQEEAVHRRPQRLLDGRRQRLGVLGLPRVVLQGDEAQAFGLLEAALVRPGHEDLRPLVREPLRRRQPDAARAPRHHLHPHLPTNDRHRTAQNHTDSLTE
mmetsp:Transcript_33654/g.107451  ORF Transcript_33654/g.107451 Transcript_33654/m.107451 type:complete len:264 (+) Transcript_33654:220-1011(+)